MRRPLTLLARSTTLHVIIGSEEIARHVRSYDTVQIIEQETHVAGVVATTRDPNAASTRGRVRLAVPPSATLLALFSRPTETSLCGHVRSLALLDNYGLQEFRGRHRRAPSDGTRSVRGRYIAPLETSRRQRGLKPLTQLRSPIARSPRSDVRPQRFEPTGDLIRSNFRDAEL